MTHEKSGLNQLGLLIILLGTIGAAEVAEAQSQPPASPGINDVKVRPSNDQPDSGWSPTPYLGKSLPASDVKHVRTTQERMMGGGTGSLPAADVKRVRTTRETSANGSASSAVAPLRTPGIDP
jgi:hypothetical protein